MFNASIQDVYSAIVVRGRRNAPSYEEVQQDNARLASAQAKAVMESRF